MTYSEMCDLRSKGKFKRPVMELVMDTLKCDTDAAYDFMGRLRCVEKIEEGRDILALYEDMLLDGAIVTDKEAMDIAYEYEDAVTCDTGELEQSIIKSIIPDKVNKDW